MSNSIKNKNRFNKIYIGIDVHLNSYSFAVYDLFEDKYLFEKQINNPTPEDVLAYVKFVKKQFDKSKEIVVGYEAGYCGFTLKRFLKQHRIKTYILAPHTIKRSAKEKTRKTDRRDAKLIAKSMANNDFSDVYVPGPLDESVRDLIRSREISVKDLVRKKEQILAFCSRRGIIYKETKTKFTQKHEQFLKKLKLDNDYDQLVLQNYLDDYFYLKRKVNNLDKDIEAIASSNAYNFKVKQLTLLPGISTLIALALIVEIGDFRRFAKANNFASFLGLTPSKDASSTKDPDLGISKQGNKFLRKLLVQGVQVFSRANATIKSKETLKFEATMPEEKVAYSDRCRERLRGRYLHLMLGLHKHHNKVKCCLAREMCGFIWGMMTGNIA